MIFWIENLMQKYFEQKIVQLLQENLDQTCNFLFSYIMFLSFLVLLNFNFFTIIFSFSFYATCFYISTLMKRFTYWPQLFLGITFNYGLILGWTAIKGEIDLVPIIFYLGAIFWTLGYDTIYGYQDIKDDEIIGLKSTSIKFKGTAKKFLYLCYSFFNLSLFSWRLLYEISLLSIIY